MREKVNDCYSCFKSYCLSCVIVKHIHVLAHVFMLWNCITNVILFCRFDQRWERLILIIKNFMMPFSSEFLTVLLNNKWEAELLEDCDLFVFWVKLVLRTFVPLCLFVDVLIVTIFLMQMADKTQDVNSWWSLLWGKLCVFPNIRALTFYWLTVCSFALHQI